MKGVITSKNLQIMHLLIAVCIFSFPAQAQYGGGTGEQNDPSPDDGSMNPDTWVNLSWPPGETAISYDVYFGDNFDDVKSGAEDTFQGNQEETAFIIGFAGFPYPDGLVPGTTYYWRIDKVNDNEPNSPWKGPVWSFSIPPRTAYSPDPSDNAESVELDVKLSWTPGIDGKLHTVYFGDNFDDVNNATGGAAQGTMTYNPGPLKMAKTYYWRVDEFDVVETHKGDVWSFTTVGAVQALDPVNGAVDVTQAPVLTWLPGLGASHEIYFGADAASLELKGRGNLGSESYDPGQLSLDTTYYWRIDEFNNNNPDSPWKGPVWSFTTATFIVVDDFESYNDIDEGERGSNNIFYAWIDGWEDPINGSFLGDIPPWVDITIAHSGRESMSFSYDNSGSANYSEVTKTLTYPRDWTEDGVDVLSLWFGDLWPWSNNTAELMYVALANRDGPSAIVYHDDPNATTIKTWTEWTIDLQAFTDQGLNLKDVHKISIGFGDRNDSQPGGTGYVYFDDIRLYRPDADPRL